MAATSLKKLSKSHHRYVSGKQVNLRANFLAGRTQNKPLSFRLYAAVELGAKCGKLHILSRVSALNPDCTIRRAFATNVRSVDPEDIPWPELVARINPYIYQLDLSTSPSLFRGTTAAPQGAAVRGAVTPHPYLRLQLQS